MRAFLFVLGLAAISWAAAPTPQALVVPGRSLGQTKLGSNATTLGALGKAAYSDAAMQKAWTTWYGRRPTDGSAPNELDVYTAPQANDVDHHTVQVVRATSPWFQLANGLRVGSSLAVIWAAYGRLPLATSYPLAAGQRYLYDDVRRGVAFETDGTAGTSRCRALIVHTPGRAVVATYLSLPAYLKELPAYRD
ncbi:hypothetical protein GO988_18435 [Hymenobacter sp. HMF4947]|uniref:Uncharacterized protein n=1 Tax=Hymenobacter ginkgonis TaxID=2682976 RepID=A0A7K1TIW1_9BACT|nr:hypothetical protein [Hymenobacter ginkgonis]MVN78312.1 hypothetical protein [Hymenobacter ginkgonis]